MTSENSRLKEHLVNATVLGTLVVAFLGPPLLGGFWLGQILSPQWNKSQEIQRFIRNRIHCKAYPTSKSMAASASSPMIELSFVGDGKKTIYRNGVIANDFPTQRELNELPISRDLRKAPDLIDLIKKGPWGLPFLASVSITFPGPTKAVINYMLSSNKGTFQTVALTLTPITVFGYIGYKYGYKPEPDYASDLFVSVLNNERFWRSIESDFLQGGYARKPKCI